MGAPVRKTQMGRMWDSTCEAIMRGLQGTPALNKDGNPIIINGEVLMLPPTAAHIREARELMAQCGIDEEPIEGSKIVEVAKAIRQFDDEADPLLLDSK